MLTFDDALSNWSPMACEKNYGPHMLESSLADWTELLALLQVRRPIGTILDNLYDMGIERTFRSGVTEAGESEPVEIQTSEALRDTVNHRIMYLGDSYPFRLDQFDCLVMKDAADMHMAYLLLLIISLLKGYVHAQDCHVLDPLTKAFEYLTGSLLGLGGMQYAVVGTSSGAGKFDAKLAEAASALNLPANPLAAPRSSSAKDDGVDVIGGHIWADGRKGNVLVLVQCACGKSNQWESKLHGIPDKRWQQYFGECSQPYRVLSVPYDVTDRAISTFLYGDNCTYFDRLRLVKSAEHSLLPREVFDNTHISQVLNYSNSFFNFTIP